MDNLFTTFLEERKEIIKTNLEELKNFSKNKEDAIEDFYRKYPRLAEHFDKSDMKKKSHMDFIGILTDAIIKSDYEEIEDKNSILKYIKKEFCPYKQNDNLVHFANFDNLVQDIRNDNPEVNQSPIEDFYPLNNLDNNVRPIRGNRDLDSREDIDVIESNGISEFTGGATGHTIENINYFYNEIYTNTIFDYQFPNKKVIDEDKLKKKEINLLKSTSTDKVFCIRYFGDEKKYKNFNGIYKEKLYDNGHFKIGILKNITIKDERYIYCLCNHNDNMSCNLVIIDKKNNNFEYVLQDIDYSINEYHTILEQRYYLFNIDSINMEQKNEYFVISEFSEQEIYDSWRDINIICDKYLKLSQYSGQLYSDLNTWDPKDINKFDENMCGQLRVELINDESSDICIEGIYNLGFFSIGNNFIKCYMNQSGCIIVKIGINNQTFLNDKKINMSDRIWVLISTSGEIFYCGTTLKDGLWIKCTKKYPTKDNTNTKYAEEMEKIATRNKFGLYNYQRGIFVNSIFHGREIKREEITHKCKNEDLYGIMTDKNLEFNTVKKFETFIKDNQLPDDILNFNHTLVFEYSEGESFSHYQFAKIYYKWNNFDNESLVGRNDYYYCYKNINNNLVKIVKIRDSKNKLRWCLIEDLINDKRQFISISPKTDIEGALIPGYWNFGEDCIGENENMGEEFNIIKYEYCSVLDISYKENAELIEYFYYDFYIDNKICYLNQSIFNDIEIPGKFIYISPIKNNADKEEYEACGMYKFRENYHLSTLDMDWDISCYVKEENKDYFHMIYFDSINLNNIKYIVLCISVVNKTLNHNDEEILLIKPIFLYPIKNVRFGQVYGIGSSIIYSKTLEPFYLTVDDIFPSENGMMEDLFNNLTLEEIFTVAKSEQFTNLILGIPFSIIVSDGINRSRFTYNKEESVNIEDTSYYYMSDTINNDGIIFKYDYALWFYMVDDNLYACPANYNYFNNGLTEGYWTCINNTYVNPVYVRLSPILLDAENNPSNDNYDIGALIEKEENVIGNMNDLFFHNESIAVSSAIIETEDIDLFKNIDNKVELESKIIRPDINVDIKENKYFYFLQYIERKLDVHKDRFGFSNNKKLGGFLKKYENNKGTDIYQLLYEKMAQYTINSISFQGEAGIDAGGLRPEFFNLVLKDIFHNFFSQLDLKEELDLILKPDKKRNVGIRKNKKNKKKKKTKKNSNSFNYRSTKKSKKRAKSVDTEIMLIPRKIKELERQFEMEYKSMKQSGQFKKKFKGKNKKQKTLLSKKERHYKKHLMEEYIKTKLGKSSSSSGNGNGNRSLDNNLARYIPNMDKVNKKLEELDVKEILTLRKYETNYFRNEECGIDLTYYICGLAISSILGCDNGFNKDKKIFLGLNLNHYLVTLMTGHYLQTYLGLFISFKHDFKQLFQYMETGELDLYFMYDSLEKNFSKFLPEEDDLVEEDLLCVMYMFMLQKYESNLLRELFFFRTGFFDNIKIARNDIINVMKGDSVNYDKMVKIINSSNYETEFHGEDKELIIENIKKLMLELMEENKDNNKFFVLLNKFWTGSEYLSADYKIFILNGDNTKLPTSSTCFNSLKLYNYDSLDILRDKLTLSIMEGQEGYELY